MTSNRLTAHSCDGKPVFLGTRLAKPTKNFDRVLQKRVGVRSFTEDPGHPTLTSTAKNVDESAKAEGRKVIVTTFLG